eukprot:TRINITY_DN8803_c1_g1_i1.p1 TRINITY_DN8803_c1_g1~~TRINITY_DN8803_c1_g1_i1.p1  ORF type:complete len:135 (+),score=8.62 TRINITY_DN8803_c1_g1_i1:10-414(+)
MHLGVHVYLTVVPSGMVAPSGTTVRLLILTESPIVTLSPMTAFCPMSLFDPIVDFEPMTADLLTTVSSPTELFLEMRTLLWTSTLFPRITSLPSDDFCWTVVRFSILAPPPTVEDRCIVTLSSNVAATSTTASA